MNGCLLLPGLITACALASLPSTAQAKGLAFDVTVKGQIKESWQRTGHTQFAPCAPNQDRSGQATITFAAPKSRVLIGLDRGIRGQVVADVHVERTGADNSQPTEAGCEIERESTSACGAHDFKSAIKFPNERAFSFYLLEGERHRYSNYANGCPYPPNNPTWNNDFESIMALWKTESKADWRGHVFGGCTAGGKDRRPRNRFQIRYADRIVAPYGNGWGGKYAADVEWTVDFKRVARRYKVPRCSSIR